MFVCICNALKDKELVEAAQGDVCNVAEVFKRCGRRPQCGKCLPDVADIIETVQIEGGVGLAPAE